MTWVDIVVIILLIIGFAGGTREGAVKSAFSLVACVISIPLTGVSYRLLATVFSFLPGENWENFVGFFITFAIFNVIFQLAALIPRKLIGAMWKKGLVFRLTGGAINVLSSIIGMVLFVVVVQAYPIFDWLERWVSGSGVLQSLVDAFGFVQSMLPDVFQSAAVIL